MALIGSSDSFNNKVFGALCAGAFLLAALWSWASGSPILAVVHLCISGLLLFVTLFFSARLTRATNAWITLGNWVGRIVNPVVLGVIFALMFIPVGLLFKLVRRDVLQRSFSDDLSYWVVRKEPKIAPDDFRKQY